MNAIFESPRLSTPEFVGPPREWFLGEEWFARDLEAVFRPRWLFAGHLSEISEPGQYITYTLGGEEIFIRKDAAGEVRAYHNFCTHRGARLCQEPKGIMGPRIVCPYHAWSFSPADGALLGAPAMHDGFDRSPWRLRPAHVGVWRGLIFVCFADQQPLPLDEHLGDEQLGGYDFSRVKLIAIDTWQVEANWKIVVENDHECYHCPLIHPGAFEDWMEWGANPNEFDTIVADGAAAGRVQRYVYERTLFTPDNQRVCAVPLPRHDDNTEPAVFGMRWSPFGGMSLTRDYASVFVARPVGPSRTEGKLYWFVADAARAGQDYEIDRVKQFFVTVFAQDKKVCENVQIGIQMPRYTPGPLNRSHQAGQAGFYAWYFEQIGQRFPEQVSANRGRWIAPGERTPA